MPNLGVGFDDDRGLRADGNGYSEVQAIRGNVETWKLCHLETLVR